MSQWINQSISHIASRCESCRTGSPSFLPYPLSSLPSSFISVCFPSFLLSFFTESLLPSLPSLLASFLLHSWLEFFFRSFLPHWVPPSFFSPSLFFFPSFLPTLSLFAAFLPSYLPSLPSSKILSCFLLSFLAMHLPSIPFRYISPWQVAKRFEIPFIILRLF